MQQKSNQHGLTLIELLVVLLVIAVVSGIAVVRFGNTQAAKIDSLEKSFSDYFLLLRNEAILNGRIYGVFIDEDHFTTKSLVSNNNKSLSEEDNSSDNTQNSQPKNTDPNKNEPEFTKHFKPPPLPTWTNEDIDGLYWDKTKLQVTWNFESVVAQKMALIEERLKKLFEDENTDISTIQPNLTFWPSGKIEPAGNILITDLDNQTKLQINWNHNGELTFKKTPAK